MVERLDHRAWPGRASRARPLGARPRAHEWWPDPAHPPADGARGGLPAVRLGAHRADLGVRRHGVQGALPLHRLSRAVRAREGDLMSSVAEVPAQRASKPAFHPLKVAAVEELTDDAVAVTFEVP